MPFPLASTPGRTAPDRWWVLGTLGVMGAVTEWIRSPTLPVAVVVGLAALLTAVLLIGSRFGWGSRLLAGLMMAIGVIVPARQATLQELSSSWPEAREARIDAASRRLEGDLRADLRRISRLAGQVVELLPLDDEALFHALPPLVPAGGVETGVALFRPDGTLRAWAGRHRLLPVAEGDSLAVRFSEYLNIFESRRSAPDGSLVVASLLLDADPSIPGHESSLSERFRQRTEVGLDVYAPGLAPEGGDIFDYEEPTTAGPRVLFSVRTVPPSQADATERAMAGAGRLATLLAVAIVLVAIAVAHSAGVRHLMLVALLWLVYRAPALLLLGLDTLAAPSLFYREFPLGIALVAGPLMLAGFLLTVLGVRLWRAETPRSAPALASGLLLLVAAPFVVRTLGQGITPPVDGVSIPLWLSWETVLLMATAGVVVPAAGLMRGSGRTGRAWLPLIGACLACLAAVLGLYAWEGRSGWPDWYSLAWLPALILVTRPAARWAAILGVAVVAGSAAALMTWGAELEGRVELARRDLMHLGSEPELLAEPILLGFANGLEGPRFPSNEAALLAAWRRSGLDRQGYPVRLELRSDSGPAHAVVELDQLDLPDSLMAARARLLPTAARDTILALARTPGLHHLLLRRLAPDTVLVVALGPRSQLVAPARLGRLTRPPSTRRPAYVVNLSPGPPLVGTEADQVRWRREGWTIRGERTVVLPGGPRQAYASVEMLRPAPLVIRGALVLLLNVALLGVLWRIAEWISGDPLTWPRWRRMNRSFRAQLAVTMSGFFVLPVMLFAAWSIFRLNEDAARSREVVVTQLLRDALAGEPDLAAGSPDPDAQLATVARRVDAELGLYRGGVLVAGTSGVLGAFGLLAPVMGADAYHSLRLAGERDAFESRLGAGQPGMIGYRSFRPPGSEESAVLATPQSSGDPRLAEEQLDLLLALLLASLGGVLAALVGARLVALRLSRPVSDLQRSALAFGEGRGLLIPSALPPVEFEPVFAAFRKMANDIQSNQAGQERAARVLAWGEMARQVAHEIKNPLTPMRLGIQHLQRVWRDRQEQIGPALEETAPRVLAEIDRLDRIARSFSRYGAPAEAGPGLEWVDLPRELGEVVPLYQFGEAPMVVEVDAAGASPVQARRDEVKEVLLNLLENARNARARRVVLRAHGSALTVTDDGTGMSAELLGRIFEPRFSSTTSGSGLGLAIVRRLVEGWGGTISVSSREGEGTVFSIRFGGAEGQGAGGPEGQRAPNAPRFPASPPTR